MKVSYDFHIHTDASPCGDETMTPHNIIHMARLLEKQVIAITDHNTCANCEVVMEVGKEQGILVIPGMEVECMEEFHLIALFPGMEEAYAFEKYVQAAMLPIPNKPHIFGHQYILGKNDEVVGEIENLLLSAVQHSVYSLYEEVKRLDGILYPAHIDRNAYSILTNLGTLPQDLPFRNIEISNQAPVGYEAAYEGYRILRGSDAHYLETLCDMEAYMELETLCKSEVFKKLRK